MGGIVLSSVRSCTQAGRALGGVFCTISRISPMRVRSELERPQLEGCHLLGGKWAEQSAQSEKCDKKTIHEGPPRSRRGRVAGVVREQGRA
jgi:hypothetical protein